MFILEWLTKQSHFSSIYKHIVVVYKNIESSYMQLLGVVEK